MDNFKRNIPREARKNTSIDGFLSRPKKSPGHRAYDRNRTLKARPGAVEGFRRADGFYAREPAPSITDDRHTGRRQLRGTDKAQPSAPEARQSRRTRKNKEAPGKRHLLRKSLSTFTVLVLLGGGYLFGKGYLNLLQVFKGGGNAAALQENVDPATLKGEGDGRVNILLLGRGGDGHEGSDLTDTIIVASVDPVNKKAALLGIPRDLWVQPDGYGAMKINSVFAAGKNMADEGENPDDEGMQLLEETLEDTIGIPIHYHATIDFEGFKQAVDTVGGVTIDVPEELEAHDNMHYFGSPYTLDVESGKQNFDGLRALMFSRTRAVGSDFERSERQRLVMLALKDKVLNLGTYGNPVKVNQLLSDLGNHVSSNFTTEEMLRVYEIVQEIPSNQIASIGLAEKEKPLVTTETIYFGGRPNSIVRPVEGMFEFDAIKHFVRNALRDGFLENESATVAVYNGTDIGGLAGRTARELESFGYKVSVVADAPSKSRAETVLVDLTNGEKKYTRAYLEKRFGVRAVSSIPDAGITPGEADFVIILGTNEETRLEN